jgi:hypothetical protein
VLAKIRCRLSYANVVATVALFAALGGTAVAAATITGKDVKDDSLSGADVKDESLGSKDVSGLKTKDFLKSERAKLKGPKGDRGRRGLQGVPGPAATQIHYKATAGQPVATLFTRAGLTVKAKCPDQSGGAADYVTVTGITDTAHSVIGIGPISSTPSGGFNPTTPLVNPGVDDDFNPGEFQTADIDDTATVLSYGRGADSTPVVTATFLANYYTQTGECKIVGTLLGG